MPATAIICAACGDVITEHGGVVVVTVAAPGQSGRRLTVCVECARLLLARLRGRPADLAAAE